MTGPTPPAPRDSMEGPWREGLRWERGWTRLLLAFGAFVLLPQIPQFGAMLPVVHVELLLVPAMAACCLVGWWAGGRASLALAAVALAVWVLPFRLVASDPYFNLLRGWSLLLAGSFGLVCLFSGRRPFFPRALAAATITLFLALVMSSFGPVSITQAQRMVAEELARRDQQAVAMLDTFIGQHPKEWGQLTASVPQLATLPAEVEKMLATLSRAGAAVFPSLLLLQSLAALALVWAYYHRLARTRLGPPLGSLRDFRFNDQLVWGLIVGLTIVFLPTLSALRGAGRNFLVFFGALYAIRGFGVLAWFLAPGALAATLTVGFAMLWAPVLNAVAVLGFVVLLLAAFGLGLGDTWADFRNRARPTT